MQEAAWLLDQGLTPDEKCAARAIGYRQAMEFLHLCREDTAHITADNLASHPHPKPRQSSSLVHCIVLL